MDYISLGYGWLDPSVSEPTEAWRTRSSGLRETGWFPVDNLCDEDEAQRKDVPTRERPPERMRNRTRLFEQYNNLTWEPVSPRPSHGQAVSLAEQDEDDLWQDELFTASTPTHIEKRGFFQSREDLAAGGIPNNVGGTSYDLAPITPPRRPRCPFNTDAGDDASTALMFTLSKCFIRSYHPPSQNHLDLVDDPEPSTSPDAASKLCLRAESRKIRPAKGLAIRAAYRRPKVLKLCRALLACYALSSFVTLARPSGSIFFGTLVTGTVSTLCSFVQLTSGLDGDRKDLDFIITNKSLSGLSMLFSILFCAIVLQGWLKGREKHVFIMLISILTPGVCYRANRPMVQQGHHWLEGIPFFNNICAVFVLCGIKVVREMRPTPSPGLPGPRGPSPAAGRDEDSYLRRTWTDARGRGTA